ncbi:hypothetical protein H6G76_28215 [Nostoc sp. FACHB-152]|uniref:hypothetical protein n=1 Tax=unclassified Nostoc TaxID=2593658 RepID=UPI001685B836|nr:MULTISPECIES: hypothetical protein [unclassified Nostoc]MBD2450945.1 hypothetical protein [Nostoc sp. FACHB-152]MBD2469990.1 hypothetical protein [Nostoc sp. FACHB-145]
MSHWLSIAFVAYLMGAAIEGIGTASQLSHSLPEISKNTRPQLSKSANQFEQNWRIFVAIGTVTVCGACIWPCRLLHRLIKRKVSSEDS